MLRIGFMFISFLFIFCTSLLNAKHIEADYSVEFGMFGEVGKVHATLTSDNRYYMLDANVSAEGIARAVTDDLKERHISKGHIFKGFLVTDMYQMIKSYGHYTSTTIYRVDHKKKRLTRQYKKWKYDKQIRNETEALEYYGKDDMMTLFLNFPKHIKQKQTAKKYRFKAIGADRKNGRVDVTIPTQNALEQMKSLVGEDQEGDWYCTVVMYRKLYQSKQGELDVRIGKEGLVEKAVLKDLIFFGDVRIIRQ
ncbi:MAG: hypothetical protein KC427_08840 [Sulfurovum sp.]|uniref:hypothetical protein n=1 Tax=Sulfurovum sp. TaxID=1969726 RepID=UPI002867E848|nr:hypothetical protein [Sulfurovum sp.]MCO4846109.1 hypothetical protein [Sulfurovum sp.]